MTPEKGSVNPENITEDLRRMVFDFIKKNAPKKSIDLLQAAGFELDDIADELMLRFNQHSAKNFKREKGAFSTFVYGSLPYVLKNIINEVMAKKRGFGKTVSLETDTKAQGSNPETLKEFLSNTHQDTAINSNPELVFNSTADMQVLNEVLAGIVSPENPFKLQTEDAQALKAVYIEHKLQKDFAKEQGIGTERVNFRLNRGINKIRKAFKNKL